MGRWEPGTRLRLQRTALDLFLERGFDDTTVAAIAARAGVTERTFFRYFGDKREVLFDGQEALLTTFVAAVEDAPPGTSVMELIALALDSVGELFPAERQEYSRRRQAAIDATPSLQERELLKLAVMTASMADALRARGTPDPRATLAAETAITVFQVSFPRWRAEDPPRDLVELQRETLAELRALVR